MRTDPILAGPRTLPAGTDGYRVPLTMTVEGGLHYLRGNAAPHFSLTYTQHRKGFPEQCYSGGAGHDTILRFYPRFADLAALHLSDIDGVPMHAEANGWYWLGGAMGGNGSEYHGGNGQYGKTPAACLTLFAQHCRISEERAATIRDGARDVHDYGGDWNKARAWWSSLMDSMRPRWKAEADAAIAKYGLRVYGDPWPTQEDA